MNNVSAVQQRTSAAGVVFMETLRRNWRGALLWALGIGAMGASSVLVIPNSETLQQYADIMKTMPPIVINMLGGGDVTFFASPEGMLAAIYFGWILLVFATYGVLAGLNVTAIEEDRGIMDIVLSAPLSRVRLVVEKLAAYSVLVVSIVLISHAMLAALIAASPIFSVSQARLLEASLNIIPGTLFTITFTALVATIVRRRNTAAAIAATYIGASYFVDVLGRTAQAGDVLRVFSFYSYYDSTGVLQNGLAWGSMLGLLVVTVVMAAGAVFFFNRRDLNL